MKVGDMVRYKGWIQYTDAVKHFSSTDPVGLVVDQKSNGNEFHHRIRVMWMSTEPPIQAKALSIKGGKITTWVHPKHFEVINESR
jgi:hypothetical protein